MNAKKIVSVIMALCIMVGMLSVYSMADTVVAEETVTAPGANVNVYGSRYSTNPADWLADGGVDAREEYIMPDKGNTGYVSRYEDLEDFGEKYPLVPRSENKDYTVTSTGEVIDNGYKYTITEAVARNYGYVFEGFKIEAGYISIESTLTQDVVFRDFYMDVRMNSTGFSAGRNLTQKRVIILDGEMLGSTHALISGFNMTGKRLYMHHCQADHVKGFTGLTLVSCLLIQGGLNGGTPHPDGIQFSVDDGHGKPLDTNDVYVIGNRFDNMLTSKNHTNACIIIKSEFGGGIGNMHIEHNWFSGGGVAIQVFDGQGMTYFNDVTICNNIFGMGARWWNEMIKYGSCTVAGVYYKSMKSVMKDITGNVYVDNLQVGGICYRDSQGRLVTDLSSVTDGSLTVTATVTNYLWEAREFYVQATLYGADNQPIATVGEKNGLHAYTPYDDYWGNGTYFGHEDQPLDRHFSLTFSELPADLSGCYVVTNVFEFKDDGKSLNSLRQDTVAAAGAAVGSFAVVVPSGYSMYDKDANSPSSLFVKAVEVARNATGDDLRLAILAAQQYEADAKDNISGVADARITFAAQIERYNDMIAADNALMAQAMQAMGSKKEAN